MFKCQHHESRKSLSLLLTLEHAYCKKSQLLRGTFYFTQVQGPNALTTLLHLADAMNLKLFLCMTILQVPIWMTCIYYAVPWGCWQTFDVIKECIWLSFCSCFDTFWFLRLTKYWCWNLYLNGDDVYQVIFRFTLFVLKQKRVVKSGN